ncbi:MAG: 3-oxoacyl-[acyl-carrier-protein] synthase III C-terminal domain-containing protein [Blastomonas sp.]
MTEFGITSFGAYIPRLRLERAAIAGAHRWMAPNLKGLGKGVRAFCNWDEDAVTMAIEAARDALGDSDRAGISAIGFASTRSPYADLQPTAIMARPLGLSTNLRSIDSGFTQRAGTSGLLAALKSGEPTLFIASDEPKGKPASQQEMLFGAAAAAFVTGTQNVIARLIGAGTSISNFVDHFRDSGSDFDYGWEERWIRDEGYAKLIPAAVSEALDNAGLAIGDIDHFAMASMLRGGAAPIAKTLRFTGNIVSDLDGECGYAGAAHAPLMLALALETANPGEKILLVGFGQGADVLIFEVTDAIAEARPKRGVTGSLKAGVATQDYLRLLSFAGGIDLEWGMRSEKSAKTALTEQYRSRTQMDGFMAGKCGDCGTIQFPQLQYCARCHAPAERFSDVSLCDAPAKVMTQTADWLSYYPSPPLYVGFVQFDNGARLQMEIVDIGPDGIETGTPLDMVFRIKERDRQRGYNRYFWKAVPALAGGKA